MASRCASLRKILNPVSGSAVLESWSDLEFFDLDSSIYLSTQPRTLELFTTIRIIEEVLELSIPVPLARRYEREETEHVLEFEMHQAQDPTPSNPFVCRLKHQLLRDF